MSGIHVGDPKSSPCPERNPNDPIHLPILQSLVVTSSALTEAVSTLPFLPEFSDGTILKVCLWNGTV